MTRINSTDDNCFFNFQTVAQSRWTEGDWYEPTDEEMAEWFALPPQKIDKPPFLALQEAAEAVNNWARYIVTVPFQSLRFSLRPPYQVTVINLEEEN